ncbi:MAG: hypothetical protein R3B48_09490 [Kofleriaceae bacterium]
MAGDPPLVIGNLDCEARWHGAVLPRRVLEHISAAATLMRYLFDEPIELWTPAAVDPTRLTQLAGAPALTLRTGARPTTAAGAWGAFCDRARAPLVRDRYRVTSPPSIAVARAVNDRRFAAALAERLTLAPPGATQVTSIDELRRHLAAGGAAASETRAWVCKAPLSAAGRDRVLGAGESLSGELERAVAHLLRRFDVVMFEPWLARVADLGVCAAVREDVVEQRPPHALVTSARGTFLGIALTPPTLTDAQRQALTHATAAVGEALRGAGYLGAFTVDAFLYRDAAGAEHLRPLCEVNARVSFGWIAAALAERHGFAELGFSTPPAEATELIAARPGQIAAWAR